jgi:CspA family cold shock protein
MCHAGLHARARRAGRELGTKEVVLMPTGKVKWFDPKKGYGFIIGEEGQDVFVHYTSIVGDGFRALKDGEVVDYELIRGEKGFQARNVKRPDSGGLSGSQQPSA